MYIRIPEKKLKYKIIPCCISKKQKSYVTFGKKKSHLISNKLKFPHCIDFQVASHS